MTTLLSRGLLALILAMLAFSPALAQTFTIKISSPTTNDITLEWMKAFKAGVETRAKGRIEVQMYPANQLGSIPQTVEGVAIGTIEVVAPATGFLIGLDPRFQIFDAAGLFDSMEHAQKVLSDPDVRKRLSTFGATKGVEIIAIYPHGPLMLLSHKPIRAAADFRGQKIRVPGAAPLHLEPFKNLGALPVSLPLGEVLPALQNHAIDGLIGGASIFTAFKYYDVATALTELPSSFLIVAIVANTDFLRSLGPELEKAVREEARKAEAATAAWAVQDIDRTFETWKSKGGEVIMLPAAERRHYLEEVTSVLPKIVGANPAMKEDYATMLAAGKKYRQ
jgi:TRAP-type C4-dicarboxylate transport system substrate-binding protein